MTVLTHPTMNDLMAFAVGKLEDGEAIYVAEHLDGCTECRSAVESNPGDSFVALVRGARPDQDGATLSSPLAETRTALDKSDTATSKPVTPAELPAGLVDHPKFSVLGPLGQGGMGTVYMAEHRVMERPVALKVINQALLANPQASQRFFSEVRAAAKLAHPNVVAAYDAEKVGDAYVLIMEYVQGNNLANYLQQHGPLPIAQACDIARQTAVGLQHAHEQGMVHRDIKPHNLMLTSTGTVKVLDFGLARLASERAGGRGLTETGSFVGTPEFVSPEQAQDARTADIRADIYSLGCTLFCLLAGRPPFHSKTAVQLILAHINDRPESVQRIRPDVPPELAAIIAKMLAKDPAAHYQTPAEVAQALVPFCTSTPRKKVTPPRKRFWVAAACIGLAAVLLAAPFVMRLQTANGQLVIKSDDADVQIIVLQGGKEVQIKDVKKGEETILTLKEGEYTVALGKNGEGMKLQTDHFTLTRDGKEIIKVWREEPAMTYTQPKPGAANVRVWQWPGRPSGPFFAKPPMQAQPPIEVVPEKAPEWPPTVSPPRANLRGSATVTPAPRYSPIRPMELAPHPPVIMPAIPKPSSTDNKDAPRSNAAPPDRVYGVPTVVTEVEIHANKQRDAAADIALFAGFLQLLPPEQAAQVLEDIVGNDRDLVVKTLAKMDQDRAVTILAKFKNANRAAQLRALVKDYQTAGKLRKPAGYLAPVPAAR